MDRSQQDINLTPPPRPRPPSMAFALPPLPTFGSTWDFSQFRSQSPSSPQLPTTPSTTRIATATSTPSKLHAASTINPPPWPEDRRKVKMSSTKVPPPSPRFQPVQPMNDQAMKNVSAYASLSLHITKSSTDLTAVPGLTDSFTSSSCSSDEHEHPSDTDVEEDPYHTSSNNAWDSYYTPEQEAEDPYDAACEQSYILPSAESCYALGFGKRPETPSPVKNPSPVRRPTRPSLTRTRTAPQPASVRPSISVRRAPTTPQPASIRPSTSTRRNPPTPQPASISPSASLSMRRNPSSKSTKSCRTITQSRFNSSHSFQSTIKRTTSETRRIAFVPRSKTPTEFTRASAPMPAPGPMETWQPLPPLPPLPMMPSRIGYGYPRLSTDRADRGRGMERGLLENYTPPYLSLFPLSARHSTPNGEVPPWPVPTRRAPRPVTAPATEGRDGALGMSATTVVGSAGGVVVVPPGRTPVGTPGRAPVGVERSVWEEDSDIEVEEEYKERKSMGKWHLRTGSSSSKGSMRKVEGGRMGKKEGAREKERWGKRSASDVVRSLFGKHGGH